MLTKEKKKFMIVIIQLYIFKLSSKNEYQYLLLKYLSITKVGIDANMLVSTQAKPTSSVYANM